MDILLASSSPRRRILLEKCGFKFSTLNPPEPHHLAENKSAREECLRMAEFKAEWAALRNPQMLVIGADTIVSVGEIKLRKPKDAKEAQRQLNLISSKKFEVYSATCICFFSKKTRIRKRFWVDKSVLECRSLGKKEIADYIKTGRWEGKAGSFNIIEKPASSWINARKQDLDSIAGLGTERLKKEIEKFRLRNRKNMPA